MQGTQQPRQRLLCTPVPEVVAAFRGAREQEGRWAPEKRQEARWPREGRCGSRFGPHGAEPAWAPAPSHGPASTSPGQPFVLVGLDAIGRAVGAGQGAVKRWIREDGFPARRCSDGTYRADPDAVRRWFWGSMAPPP